jgi:rSAM/selenodomain-associated transferase 2
VRLSIIIPVLNEGRLALACARRLASLREAGHELILVDGGSDELAVDQLSPWVDQLLLSEPGRARQMNRGARLAQGEVFWFLHADTRVEEGCVAAMQLALEQGAGWGRFDIRLDGSKSLLRLVERMMNLRSRWSGIATGDQGIFIRRALFQQVGGYPDQALMEDVEISRRLKRLRRPACLQTRLLSSSRRWDRQGVVRTILLMWGLRLAYWLGVSPQHLAAYYR